MKNRNFVAVVVKDDLIKTGLLGTQGIVSFLVSLVFSALIQVPHGKAAPKIFGKIVTGLDVKWRFLASWNLKTYCY